MTYTCYIPSPPLNAYINGFYYADQPMPYRREKILPMPWLNLMINFGGKCEAYQADQTQPFISCRESWWVGLWSGYHIIEWPVDMQLLVVDFKPGGAYPFLHLPLSELHDEVVILDVIWGRFAAEIRERLYAAPTTQARFKLLETLLLTRLSEGQAGLDAVQYAIGQIVRQQGALSIQALSDQMGMSQKHLITLFKRMTGGTPKELARLYRFQNILYSIDSTRPVDWTRVAHQACYYDQSHFNKDFESFTGHNPGDYLRLRQRIQAENPEHAPFVRQLLIG